ncbi:hypothetical protein LUZ60_011012 [Juncus effusus]|nr:hypothetical protein LUZ60_011012 [Juncus effusus]
MESSSKSQSSTEPLLPQSSGETTTAGAGASISGAVFNISTSMVGAGIMSIPAAMKILGVIPALFLIAAVAFLSDRSTEFMLRYTGWSLGPQSYAGIMSDAFGRAGSTVLNLCVALTMAGMLVVYLIIVGDVMCGSASGEAAAEHAGVLVEWFGEQWWNRREMALLIIVVFVLLPLVLIKRVDSLRHTSAISILLAVIYMFISLGIAIYAIFQGAIKSPRLFPDFTNLPSIFDLFTAIPVIVLSFTFHFNVHPIRAEMKKTTELTSAVRISLILCSLIYSLVGFFGYLLFGDNTMDDILSNYSNSGSSPVPPFLNDIVRISYVLHLLLVFPLLHYSLRVNVDELFFGESRLSDLRFGCWTGVLMGLIYFGAVRIPSIWTLFQYFGSTTAVCLSLIFPASVVLRDVHGIAKRKDKALAASMIGLAVITSFIAIASNLMSQIRN